MIYGSVCSGIESASVAWHPLGWKPAFFAEIDKFPSAVLAHHYPDVPNAGDFTKINEDDFGAIDLLVGGTPCQSFSVAGKRLGLDDPRGNLALEFLALARRLRPRWLVFENVPGLLSSDEGRDFGAFLGLLGECGYGWAYRVLDAQYVRVDGYARAVPQRRRSVFVVGYFGDWRPAAAVLLEPEGLRGDSPPSREAGKGAAGNPGGSSQSGGFRTTDLDNQGAFVVGGEVADPAFSCKDHGADADDESSPTLRAMGHDKSHANAGGQVAVAFMPTRNFGEDGGVDETFRERDVCDSLHTAQGNKAPLAVSFKPSHYTRGKDGAPSEVVPPLGAEPDKGDQEPVVFQTRIARNGRGQPDEVCPALNGADAGETSDMRPCVASRAAVRRLTPRECERLQGFPDDYTLIPYWPAARRKLEEDYIKYLLRNGSLTREQCFKLAADGPRCKALGNAMAIPPMRWIGARIAMFDRLRKEAA